jgi:hypothetical protein
LICPFAFVVLFTTNWYYFFLILMSIGIISFIKIKNYTTQTNLRFLSTIIPASAFETLSGCRRNYIFWGLVLIYFSALGFTWVRGLPLFLLWLITTSVSAFFGEYEPLNILRKDGTLSNQQFLMQKSKRYIIPFTVIYAPIFILNGLFHPDLWLINGLFLILQILSFNFAILYKYATYHHKAYFNTNSPILILVGLCNLIPFLIPLILFLNIQYYFKAIKNLNNYLQ